MVRKLYLGREDVVAIVDNNDYQWASQLTWYLNENNFVTRHNTVTTRFLHKELLGATKGQYVDHVNGNRLDNRRCNLRKCTNSQNMANIGKPKHNTSGYKGVSFGKDRGKYRATIQVSRRAVHLGYYATAEEAANAYDRAAIAYYGEFARTNKAELEDTSHLFTMSEYDQQDIVQQKLRRRQQKLDTSIARTIRARYGPPRKRGHQLRDAGKITLQELADEYGVSTVTISAIVRNKMYQEDVKSTLDAVFA